jgi:SpoIIAA-like
MVTSIETQRENLVAIRLTGTLEKQDYDRLVPVLEGKIHQFGKIDLYWEMDAVQGWQPGGLWEEIKFDIKHANSFRKVAIVGDKQWEKWIAQLIKPFTTAEVRYFDVHQKEQAMAWLG